MTLPPEILLSDKFADFSGKVTALHEKKKEQEADFKKAYLAHKASIKAIDDEAADLQDNFNNWAMQEAKVEKAQAQKAPAKAPPAKQNS